MARDGGAGGGTRRTGARVGVGRRGDGPSVTERGSHGADEGSWAILNSNNNDNSNNNNNNDNNNMTIIIICNNNNNNKTITVFVWHAARVSVFLKF